ncbi:hypothetical protein ACFCXH_00350 [Streptomyces nojiriensis]|uniref:hypothetical protein n=1 Tax=Streptomyces nojiriensis TaxID=66374 RepID=UPI0035D9320B
MASVAQLHQLQRSVANYDAHDSGVHVFTGRADSDSAAIKAAHEVYDAACAAAEAGREIPHGRPDGWGACGYRPGWELDWPAAKAGPWKSPYSRVTTQPFEP